MKRIYLVLIMALCIIPATFARLEIDEIRVYVNDERDFGADENGGDIEVDKGDNLMLKVYLKNDMDNITRVRLKALLENIDEGSDVIKWQPNDNGWFEIDANDDRSKTLSFSIPMDVTKDDYDLILTTLGKYTNNTEEELEKKEWTVVVKERDIEDTPLEEVVRNVSNVCTNVINEMSKSFKYMGRYDNVTNQLSTCKDERGSFKAQADEREKTLIQCQTDRDSYNEDKRECEERIDSFISKSACKLETDIAVELAEEEAKKKSNNTIIAIGAIGWLIWFLIKRKKGKTVYDKVYQEKKIP